MNYVTILYKIDQGTDERANERERKWLIVEKAEEKEQLI